jgi:hypothetical protein
MMHGREAESLTETEVSDGWGELVNMIGGNLNGPRVRLATLRPQR